VAAGGAPSPDRQSGRGSLTASLKPVETVLRDLGADVAGVGDAGSYAVVVSNTLDGWGYNRAIPALVGNSAAVSATSAAVTLLVAEPRIPRRHLGRQ